jgi:hypothetical protein
MSNTMIPQQNPATVAPIPVPPAGHAWTPGRTTSMILAVVLFVGAVAMFAAAGIAHVVDNELREGGYLTTDATSLDTDGYALTIEEIDLDSLDGDWLLGKARLRVATADSDAQLFVGVAPEDQVDDYLAGVQHSTVAEIGDPTTRYAEHPGGPVSVNPADSDIWDAQVTGSGTQSLEWTPRAGHWTVVVMNSDGAGGVHVTADVGATVPVLEHLDCWLAGIGSLFALTGAALAAVTVIRVRRSQRGRTS